MRCSVILFVTLFMGCKAAEEVDLDPDKDGFTEADGDCDNANADIFPGAPELCDGVANNCDEAIVEMNVPTDHATVQEAIDARDENSLICLEPGDYEENLVVVGGARIKSIAGSEATTLTGTVNAPVLDVDLSDGGEFNFEGVSIGSSATRWKNAVTLKGGDVHFRDVELSGLVSSENNPIAIQSYSSSVSLTNVEFRDLDFDRSGYALWATADFADEGDVATLSLTDVSFMDSFVGAVTTHFMGVEMDHVEVDSMGYFGTYGPVPVFNLLGGGLDIDGVEFRDTFGEINFVGRASDNVVKNIDIEGGKLNVVVFGLTKKEVQDEVEYTNQSMFVSYAEGKGNVDLTNIHISNARLYGDGLDLRGVTAEQVFVHSNTLERAQAVMELTNSEASHVALIDNLPTADDSFFRHVAGVYSSVLENFIIAGVEERPDNQYGIAIGCDSTAAFGVIYDIHSPSSYDGGGVTHQCSKAASRALLSHMAVIKTSPYGIGYNDWTGMTYPSLEHVAVAESGTSDLHSAVSWPNYSSDQLLRSGTSYASSRNYAKLPFDLFHLEADASYVDVSTTAFDPDATPADIGPFSGPKADRWDVDGDGVPAHWRPGSTPNAEQDCNDFDPTIGAGDC